MNIERLRKGNLICFNETDEYCTVKGIDADSLGLTVVFPNGEELWIEAELFSEILLKPEIINKMGFASASAAKGGKYNFWNKAEDASIDVEIDGVSPEFSFDYCIIDFKDCRRTKNITTVSQLQNLHLELKGTLLTLNQVE